MKYLIICVLLFLQGGAAYGGNGGCVWNSLPLSARQSALSAGLDGGPSALSATISPEMLLRAEEICGRTPINSVDFRRAEAGYMLQILAEAWLAANVPLSPQELNRGWTAMNGTEKEGMKRWSLVLMHDPKSHDNAYVAFKAALNHPSNLPTGSRSKILTYIQGRALREVYEPRF